MNKRPLLGANYYPEDWPESEQDHDIAMMKKAGLTVVRIGEFAWSKMEPKDGQYDFQWLHDIINKLGENGIDVVLGTPTACPPMWLEEKDPTMMRMDEFGIPQQHGARRSNCSNNATYLEYSRRIVEKMGQEFGKDPYVIGWQIDNEIAPGGVDCQCSTCRAKFAEFLQKKYGTIDELNRRWNLNLFSQHYDRFDQVLAPLKKSWLPPIQRMDWHEFHNDAHTAFVKMQYDILKKYTDTPVSTDMMPFSNMDYEKMADFMDLIQFNHYHDQDHQRRAAFWFDYLRTLTDHPFWITETATCWCGSHFTPSHLRPEGFCKANSWLPIVLGGEMNSYWLWRQHWTGHELMHGSVLYASGRPMHIFPEVQELSEEYSKAADFLSDTKVKTDVAIHFSMRNEWIFKFQPVVDGTVSATDRELRPIEPIYNAMIANGVRPDLIAPQHSLDGYKLLFSPYLLTTELGDLPNRIVEWVKNGGTWVVGPMTDIRNYDGAHYINKAMGFVEDLLGCQLVQQMPDDDHQITCQWQDGTPFMAEQWLMLYEIDEKSINLASVTGGFSSIIGKSVLFKKSVGKGQVIVLGARPDAEGLRRLTDYLLNESGSHAFRVEGAVVPACREGSNFAGIAAQEIDGKKGKLYFDGVMTDLLTGLTHEGCVELVPYQTIILSK